MINYPTLVDIKYVSNKIPKPSKKANWYKSGDYLDYISRDEAVMNIDFSNEEMILLSEKKKQCQINYKNNIKELGSLINTLVDEDKKELINSTKKTAFKSYYDSLNELTANKEYKTGLYDLNGEISKKALYFKKQAFKKIDVDNQIVWSGVISFSNDFMEKEKIYSGQQFHKIVSKNLKHFLKLNDFDIRQMETVLAFHKNTDNTHFHFSFFEKVPTKWNGKEKEFRKIGKLEKSSIRDLELNITNSIKSRKMDVKDLFKSKDYFKEKYRLNVSNVKEIFNDLSSCSEETKKEIVSISKKIQKISSENKNISFGSKKLYDSTRKELVNLTFKYIECVPELKISFDQFKLQNNVYAEKEFKRFLKTYKRDYKAISPNTSEDRILKNFDLSEQEKLWDHNFDLTSEKEYLKSKKHELLNENIISKNEDNHFQGIIPTLANLLLDELKDYDYRNIKKTKINKINQLIKHESNFSEQKWKQNKINFQVKNVINKYYIQAKRNAALLQNTIDYNKSINNKLFN